LLGAGSGGGLSEIDKFWFAFFQAHPMIERVIVILIVYAWIALACLVFARKKI
jgi:hypothetical protein